MARDDKPLEVHLKEVNKELNMLPKDTPGWIKVSLALWGMQPAVAKQVQSNPRDANGMFHDYIYFRNNALSTVHVVHGSDDKASPQVWKRQAPAPPTPPAKIVKPNALDWSKIQCKHCNQFGHGSAASRLCPRHDPNWIKKGLNQSAPQKPPKKA
jgi:hypothetical protein